MKIIKNIINYFRKLLIGEFFFHFRANSLKRAIRQLVEHSELVIDDANNPGKSLKKAPNITVTDEASNTLTCKGSIIYSLFTSQTEILK